MLPRDVISNKKILDRVDVVVTYGVLHGSMGVVRLAEERRIPWYYVDRGYMIPKRDEWFRVSLRSFAETEPGDTDSDRYDRVSDEFPVLPWRGPLTDGRVLVVPPTIAWSQMCGVRDWEERATNVLRRILPWKDISRIAVRRKRGEAVVMPDGEVRYHRSRRDRPLDEDLAEASVVVTLNSNVALDATLRGIPVCTSRINACTSVSMGIRDLRRGVAPDKFHREPSGRRRLVEWLADHQFHVDEIVDGTMWRTMTERTT